MYHFCSPQLASDAGALVAMTEAEKQRLDELLGEEDNSKVCVLFVCM